MAEGPPDKKIKLEPGVAMSQDEIATKLLTLLKDYPNGTDQDVMWQALPAVSKTDLVGALNHLSTTARLQILKTRDGKILFKLMEPQDPSASEGLTTKENVTFNAIRATANKGIWISELRSKVNISMKELKSVLKELKRKQRVNEFRTNTEQKKVMYIGAGFKPDPNLLEDRFHSGDKNFDSEFVDVIARLFLKFLKEKATAAATQTEPLSRRNHSLVKPQEVQAYINSTEILKEPMSEADVVKILNALVYDGEAERMVSGGGGTTTPEPVDLDDEPDTTGSGSGAGPSSGGPGQNRPPAATPAPWLYTAARPVIDATGLAKIPCGICPVKADCVVGGEISPHTCVYMTEWLKF